MFTVYVQVCGKHSGIRVEYEKPLALACSRSQLWRIRPRSRDTSNACKAQARHMHSYKLHSIRQPYNAIQRKELHTCIATNRTTSNGNATQFNEKNGAKLCVMLAHSAYGWLSWTSERGRAGMRSVCRAEPANIRPTDTQVRNARRPCSYS